HGRAAGGPDGGGGSPTSTPEDPESTQRAAPDGPSSKGDCEAGDHKHGWPGWEDCRPGSSEASVAATSGAPAALAGVQSHLLCQVRPLSWRTREPVKAEPPAVPSPSSLMENTGTCEGSSDLLQLQATGGSGNENQGQGAVQA
ncbi:hypothetical protein H1C71_015024, partial [Ictidomys tridecemlineatus]